MLLSSNRQCVCRHLPCHPPPPHIISPVTCPLHLPVPGAQTPQIRHELGNTPILRNCQGYTNRCRRRKRQARLCLRKQKPALIVKVRHLTQTHTLLTTLHYTTPHYTTLHYTTLHYTAHSRISFQMLIIHLN